MKTITIRMKDLTEEKQKELSKLYPFADIIKPNTIVTFVEVYDKVDLSVDIEEARIQKELDNPITH